MEGKKTKSIKKSRCSNEKKRLVYVTKCRTYSNEECSSDRRGRDENNKKNGHVPAKNIYGEQLESRLRVQGHDRLHALVQYSIPCVFRCLRVARHLLVIDERKTDKRTEARGPTDKRKKDGERESERKQGETAEREGDRAKQRQKRGQAIKRERNALYWG